MKAAAQNVLGNLALGEDIRPSLQALLTTSQTFLQENLLPMIGNVFSGIAAALPEIIPEITGMVPEIIDAVIEMLTSGGMVQNLVAGVLELVGALLVNLPTIIIKLVEAIPQIFLGILQGMQDAIDILSPIVQDFWDKGVEWLQGLWEGIKSIFAPMVSDLAAIGSNLWTTITTALGNLIDTGVTWIKGLWNGISSFVGTIVSNVINFGSNLVSSIKSGIGNLWSIGHDWLVGLWNGISDAVGWVIDKIRGMGASIVSAIKGVFGIASPSKVMRDEVGKWIPAGIAEGIQDNSFVVDNALSRIKSTAVQGISMNVNETSGTTINAANNTEVALARIIELLYEIVESDQVIKFDDREVARSLRNIGVSFA